MLKFRAFTASVFLGLAPLANATLYTWSVATPSPTSTWNTIGNWTPGTAVPGSADGALFNATGVSSSSTSPNNQVSASQSVTSLVYDQNGSTSFQVTQIPTGVTLAVTGPFTNGEISADGALTPTYFTGGGTFVASGTPFLDDNFGSTGSAALATLDLTGLSTFIYSNSAGTIDVGESPSTFSPALNRPGGVLNLAGTSNNITVGTINFMTLSGGNGGNGNSAINFGAGTNIINVGTFNIAERKNSGTAKFFTTTGGLRIRGANGNVDDTSRATITLGSVNGKTGTVQPAGKLLLAGAGHPVDIKASTMTLGLANGANGTSTSFGSGVLNFDAGTVDATTINMASCTMTAGGPASGASGTISVSNNATAGTAGTLIIGTGGLSLCNATIFTCTGNLSIYGGAVNSFGNIFKTAASTATSTNFGSVTNISGTLTMQPGTTVGTAAIPLDNFYLNNATLHMSVNAISIVTNITATNVPAVGTSTIVIDNVQYYPGGTVTWPLISYTGTDPFSGFNSAPTLPVGFTGTLVDDTAKQTIDLQITAGIITIPPAPLTWNGGSSTGNNWSDMNNWQGTNLQAGDTLFFDGNLRLNNNNDTTANTLYSNITFNATASAFTLSGNAILLGAAEGVTNLSSYPQTVDLGLSFNANLTLAGGNNGLFVGGTLANTASTGLQTISLAGTGTLTNQFAIQFNATNSFFMTNGANWTIADNAASSPVIISNAGFNITGGSTLNFGGPGQSPQLYTLEGGQGSDSLVGDNNSASTFNMNSGTLTLGRRFNSADGNLNVSGGTLNVWNQMQWANTAFGNSGTITVSGNGTLNIASATGTTAGGVLFVASRGSGTLTINGGLVECTTLDTSRNAAGNTGGTVGVVNLNGGTLQINGAVTNASANFQTGGSPTANFNFNGGTLVANKPGVLVYQGSLSSPVIPITSTVQTGGAVIQTSSGNQMIIMEPLIHDSTLGSTPDGGLTKKGADLLTLGAACTYTGNTTINGGILALSGSGALTSPHIIVSGGAAFDVTGVSGFALGSGQVISNSTSTATLSGNADASVGTLSLNYAAGTPAFTLTNGTLTLAGTTTININNTGAALANGNYEIISTNSDVSGPNAAVTGTLPSVTVTGGGLAGGALASLSIVNGELFLVVGSGTNPFPGPAPTVTYSGGQPTINFSGIPGDSYSVDRSTNLVSWQTIWTTNAPAGGLFNFTDTYTGPAAFYRLQWNLH